MRKSSIYLMMLVIVAHSGCGARNVVTQQLKTQPQSTRNDVLHDNLGGGCLEPDNVNSPWLVGLGADDRGTISRNAERGVVLVKQGECGTFQMLRDCFLSNVKYVPVISSVVRPDSVDITDRVQMQKKIPLAMARYKTEIADDEVWSLDYVDAGEYSYTGALPQIDWEMLRPSCRKATHYVYKITRGAFQLSRVNSAERKREGNIGPADFSARAKRRVREKTRDGDYARCAATGDATTTSCNGLIRMSVEPIPGVMLATRPSETREDAGGAKEDPLAAPIPRVDYGWINVTSNYKGVPVLVDGTEVGKTPLSGKRLGAGTHQVALNSRCLRDGSVSVTVAAGETQKVNVDLKPRNGSLRILSVNDNGKPIKANVYLDGKKIGETNGSLTATLFEQSVCKSGKKLVLKAEGYERYEKVVQIKERDNTDLTVALKRSSFLLGCESSASDKDGPMCASTSIDSPPIKPLERKHIFFYSPWRKVWFVSGLSLIAIGTTFAIATTYMEKKAELNELQTTMTEDEYNRNKVFNAVGWTMMAVGGIATTLFLLTPKKNEHLASAKRVGPVFNADNAVHFYVRFGISGAQIVGTF